MACHYQVTFSSQFPGRRAEEPHGEAKIESEVSRIVAVLQISTFQPTQPSLSGRLRKQLVWRLPPKKARLRAVTRMASASREPDATPGFTPGWLGLRSCFCGSWWGKSGPGSRLYWVRASLWWHVWRCAQVWDLTVHHQITQAPHPLGGFLEQELDAAHPWSPYPAQGGRRGWGSLRARGGERQHGRMCDLTGFVPSSPTEVTSPPPWTRPSPRSPAHSRWYLLPGKGKSKEGGRQKGVGGKLQRTAHWVPE